MTKKCGVSRIGEFKDANKKQQHEINNTVPFTKGNCKHVKLT